jgi:putative tryptophan/tyrosine transport system substrate-binding protein
MEIKDGIVQGMAKLGYSEGKDLKITFKTAQGNFGTAQQIARDYVGDQPDVIVPITTIATQAVVATTQSIPVVFAAVTDPVGARIIPSMAHPGGDVTGVSDLVPTQRQIELIMKIIPNLKRLGIIYDTSQDSSRSTIKSVKALAPTMGFTIIESAAMGMNGVAAAAQSLVGKVDALFVPNDATVYSVFESVVKVAQDAQMPLFSAERRSVQRGSIGTVGYNFVDMGITTAGMIDKVLRGTKPGDIPAISLADDPKGLGTYLNVNSAKKMGVTIPPAVIASATEVY